MCKDGEGICSASDLVTEEFSDSDLGKIGWMGFVLCNRGVFYKPLDELYQRMSSWGSIFEP